MNNSKDQYKIQNFPTKIDGKRINLTPVVVTLNSIGDEITNLPESRGRHALFLRGPYRNLPHIELYDRAIRASNYITTDFPDKKFSEDYIQLAAEQIVLGNIKVVDWNEQNYGEQILIGLENIGSTWQYSDDKEEAEKLIKKEGIPVIITLKGLSDLERNTVLGSQFKFIDGIDEKKLVIKTVEAYDRVMAGTNHQERKRFEALGLDELLVGIGLNLHSRGIVPLRLYKR